MIHVLAIITAKPGMREAILKEFRANMPAVHAEQGCIEYGPAIDADGSPAKFGDDTFVVIEKWESPEALKAHAASPHMAAYAREDARDDRQPRHPRPAAGLTRRRRADSSPCAAGECCGAQRSSRRFAAHRFSTGYDEISTALSSCSVICGGSG